MKFVRVLLGTCLCGVLASQVTACGAFHQEDFPTDGPLFKATANPMKVTKEDLGHSWPFDDISDISVSCKPDGDVVILRAELPDGTEYALNAVGANDGLTPIEDRASGSVGPLRSVAFGTCDFDGK
ncbi:hypothetical protein [Corynebacterium sp. CCM 9204]|uniref:hypothetical protein n=1 Tax=Corynebacterium sp. CCM 9204 TaxID=3057616 RepID=UPI003523EEA2